MGERYLLIIESVSWLVFRFGRGVTLVVHYSNLGSILLIIFENLEQRISWQASSECSRVCLSGWVCS